MKTNRSSMISRRRHELLREFFACAVVIAAIKSSHPRVDASARAGSAPSPAGRT